MIINDAFDHLEECETGKYDVILCDTTDPQGKISLIPHTECICTTMNGNALSYVIPFTPLSCWQNAPNICSIVF